MKKVIFLLGFVFLFVSLSFSQWGYHGRGYGPATFQKEGQRKVVNRQMNRHGHVGKGYGKATKTKKTSPKMYYFKKVEVTPDLAKTSPKKMNSRGFFGDGGKRAKND
jgi:hypothetical protein